MLKVKGADHDCLVCAPVPPPFRVPVHPVYGEKNNIKLTTPEDMALAHQLTAYLTQ